MDDTIKAGKKYPDKHFMHCSGFKQNQERRHLFCRSVSGLLFKWPHGWGVDEKQQARLCGCVFQRLRWFATSTPGRLESKTVNPNAKVHVRWIYAWYGPDKAREAAEALIAEGCDSLAFYRRYTGGDRSRPGTYGKGANRYIRSAITVPCRIMVKIRSYPVQLVDWGVMYEKILKDLADGTWKSEDLWWLIAEKAVILGGSFDNPINPKFVDALKVVKVTSADFGSISVHDLVFKRYEQMKKRHRRF